jgi:small subunit ribosomal protein S6
MAATPPIYDLVLMLDSAVTDEQRTKVLNDVERHIADGGAIVNRQEWGPRQTAYEIRHKTDADYHLVQFVATPDILERLQRSLRITDGVVRFRIIKLAPGTPAPPMTRAEPRPTGLVDETEMPATEAAAPAAEPVDVA